jgi:amidase
MTDVAFAPAYKLAAMIRARKIGCLELLEHYLRRVEKFNPQLNAIIVSDVEAAKKRARAADRAVARGGRLGPFHGVPMTVKEAFDVQGLPTTWGLPELSDHAAPTNALAVDRWLAAGANIFGKTNVPVWLADSQSANKLYGVTNNPWDPTRTPGGSSGGSAAAVAAGLAGIEIGSDIASSIRNPAIYCGVYGHKPTYGICPPRGHAVRGRISPDDINVIGPIARSAADLDRALSVMAGPDEIDSVGYRLALPPAKQKSLRDFRVAVLLSDPTSEVDREVQDSLQAVADFLAKRKAKVSDKARPKLDMERVHSLFNVMLRGATSHRQVDEDFARNTAAAKELAPDDDSFAARAMRGQTISHRDWLMLNEERHKLRWVWHDFFKDYDLLLCPLTPTAAIKHDPAPTTQRDIVINGKTMPFGATLFWAGFVGLPYLPATAIPTGLSKEGLPIGIQVVGSHYGDLTCIQFAKIMEKEYRGFVPPPGYAETI